MALLGGALRGDVGCDLHRSHRPRPLTLVVHHIQPRGMGGPDAETNRAAVCDTGHRNVHAILYWMVKGADPALNPGGTRAERTMAQDGYDRWVKAGRPGNPHAAAAVHAPPSFGP